MKELKDQLFFEAKRGNTRKVVELLNKGVDINVTDCTGDSLLQTAFKGTSMWKGVNVELIRTLINRGIDVNIKNNYRKDALHEASVYYIYKDGKEALNLVLDSGVDVNSRYENDKTLLMSLCSIGRSEVIKLLLEHGADVNLQDADGNTALHKALESGCFGNLDSNISQILIKNGANINIKNREGRTAIESVYLRDNKRYIEDLIISLAVNKDFDSIDLCSKDYLRVIYECEIKNIQGDLSKTDVNNLKDCINNAKNSIVDRMKEIKEIDEDGINRVQEIIEKNIGNISDLFRLEKIKDLALAKEFEQMDSCIKEYFNLIDWKVNVKNALHNSKSLENMNISAERLDKLKSYLIDTKKAMKENIDITNEDGKAMDKKEIQLINKHLENASEMYRQYVLDKVVFPVKSINVGITR